MKIRINSDDNLPLQKTLSIQNVIIFLGSIFNDNHNYCHRKVHLVECSYKSAS